jgi:hypothetical protein
MTLEEVQDLRPGIYTVQWKDGRELSLAAVGRSCDHRFWIVCTEWPMHFNSVDQIHEEIKSMHILVEKKPGEPVAVFPDHIGPTL